MAFSWTASFFLQLNEGSGIPFFFQLSCYHIFIFKVLLTWFNFVIYFCSTLINSFSVETEDSFCHFSNKVCLWPGRNAQARCCKLYIVRNMYYWVFMCITLVNLTYFVRVQADKLERLRERMIKVRELFRDTTSMEFIIVTIPTVIFAVWCCACFPKFASL